MTDAPVFPSSSGIGSLPFQKRVVEWLMACFSNEVCRDGIERNHRFLEEALELVQSLECTRSEAHQLVDYVFDRPVGEPMQELGGSLVTLVALANCHDMDVMQAGETELARVWTKIDKIRAKQATKPKHSPLPEHVVTSSTPQIAGVRAWPEPKVTNPDIADPTGVPYLDCLIHRLLDAQQGINLHANEGMSQSLSDASALLDEVETALRTAALSPQTHAGETELNELDRAIGIFGRATTETLLDPSDRYDAVKHVRDYLLGLRGRLSGAAQGSPDRGEFDPADIWDAYCDEVPEQFRSCQGAMAFALDYASPPAALPAGEDIRKQSYEVARHVIGYLEGNCGLSFIDVKQADWDAVTRLVATLAMPSTDREGGK